MRKYLKLLPFILIAEIGLAAFMIGYGIAVFSGLGSVLIMVCGLSAVAAIVFTILWALNIKLRAFIVATIICIALSVFLYLLFSAVSSLFSIFSYRAQLDVIANEDVKASVLRTITRNTILGSVSLIFAVSVLPLAVYLPIWVIKRKTVNEQTT